MLLLLLAVTTGTCSFVARILRQSKEKEELMKFLELRSQSSKCSSRPVTVSTILSKNPEPIEKSSFPVKKQQEKHETAENKLESIPEVQKVNKKKKEKSEVSDLFKNL